MEGEFMAGERMTMSAGAVDRISRDITERAHGGTAAWDAVPGFTGAAAGAAFADRGARLAAAVGRLRDSGRGTYRRLGEFSRAVAGQFEALGDADGQSSESINRIGGTR